MADRQGWGRRAWFYREVVPTDRSPRLPWWGELALTAGVTALTAQEAAVSLGGRYWGVSVLVAVAASLAIPLRHRWPLTTTLLAVTAATVWGLLLPLLVSIFHLAARNRLRLAMTALAVALAGNTVLVRTVGGPTIDVWQGRALGPFTVIALPVALGAWAASRRRLIAILATRVDDLRTERELRERAVRLAERSAIAAEMHDVLAHRLSLLALHSGVLGTRSDSLPEPVVERLALLRSTATAALDDLREVLGVLRDSSEFAEPEPAIRAVDDLVEQARAAGQQVEFTVHGDPELSPAAHRMAAYRVVREALSNVRKHSGDARVSVTLDYTAPRTEIAVANTRGGAVITPSSPGLGLVGLRERVGALGGELRAGPLATGGWSLRAELPWPAPSET